MGKCQRKVRTAPAAPDLRKGSAKFKLARTCRLNALRGSRRKMEKQTTYRRREADWRGPGSLGLFGEHLDGKHPKGDHPEGLGQGMERNQFVGDLDPLRPAAALDRFPGREAVDCAARVLGHLVARQQLPVAVEQAAEVEEGEMLEPGYRQNIGRNLFAKLGALLAGADFFENPVVT